MSKRNELMKRLRIPAKVLDDVQALRREGENVGEFVTRILTQLAEEAKHNEQKHV